MWKLLKKITTLEIIVIVVFILYLISGMSMPFAINQLIDTPLGVVVVLVLTLWIFLSTNPVLGVLTIFVAYELVRRSAGTAMAAPRAAMIQYNPIQIKRDLETVAMNANLNVDPATAAPLDRTLEEDVVSKMAPLSSGAPTYVETGFKPVAESTHNASSILF